MVLVFSSKWVNFSRGSSISCLAVGKKKKRQTKDSDVSVFWGVERAKAHCFVNLGKEVVQKKEKCRGEEPVHSRLLMWLDQISIDF